MDYLSEVKAVAIDMNASYNALVGEHMLWAERYRDEDYFFSLIQFISIPSVIFQSLKKT